MSEKEELEVLNNVSCCDCGIVFGFSPKIEKMWRESGKTFVCPNGHSLHWSKPTETPEQKELKVLRTEVKDLKTKLDEALTLTETQKKKIEELQTEIEIWKPSTKE
jgi:hypothetical protein